MSPEACGPRHWEQVYRSDRCVIWAGVDWQERSVFVAATDPAYLPDSFEQILGREPEEQKREG